MEGNRSQFAPTLWEEKGYAQQQIGRSEAELCEAKDRFPSLAPCSFKFILFAAVSLLLSGCATTTKVSSYEEINNIRLMPKVVSRDSFVWPVRGSIISSFGAKMDGTRNKGIDIQADAGKVVKASRSGTVVFSDDRLKGFGKTIILDHGDNYQTVYAYNSEILVKVGDSVRQNDIIAKSGKTGRAREPSLHFEIRKNGEPKDPYYYLAR